MCSHFRKLMAKKVKKAKKKTKKKSAAPKAKRSKAVTHPSVHGNPEFIITFFRVLVGMAWADNVLVPKEIKELKAWAGRNGLGANDWKKKLQVYVNERVTIEEFETLVQELRALITTEEQKEEIVDAMEKMAWADGELSPEEGQKQADLNARILKTSLSPLAVWWRKLRYGRRD